jgi:lipopolysaccharide transport system ATP-binding protein
MASIDFQGVHLSYPVRENRGLTLKDLILKGLFLKPKRRRWTQVDALKNISFHIGDGERVGVIGRNGAGKSTLLRVIAGIYPVHIGNRIVEGNVCSLFDIALGFEYFASGWNNIRYRGYLQGETPRTITAKMKEIADFTELGDFLDLPLNCYSTGMIMRLAFSIATSAHPEILLIDEIFSTGDIVFQAKAEARMREFIGRARIVVMVGHNLEWLQEFCTRVIWLQQGSIRAEGAPRDIIQQYRDDGALQRAAA